MFTVPQEASGRLDALAHAERVRLTFENIPGSFIAGLVGSVLVQLVLWGSVPQRWLIAWGIASVLSMATGLHLHRRYLRANPGAEQAPVWERVLLLAAVLGGTVWAAASLFLLALRDLQYQVLLVFMLSTVAVVGGTSTAATQKGSLVFASMILLTLSAALAWQSTFVHFVLAFGMLVVLITFGAFLRNFNRAISRSTRLSLENRELVAQLTVQKDQAEKANLDKTRFLAAASHDLRQPMHAMGLFVGALRERIHYPEVRALVDKIQASVDAMDSLLTSLLDISKLDAGAIVPNRASFAIRSLLERMELQYGAQARNKGLRFHVVPSSAIVLSDPALLDRIVRNLVANAVRHTSSGAVTLGCRRRGKHLSVQVLDTGPGVPQEQLDNIFQEFYQLGNPERDRRKGVGLGLSIVQRLARLLNHEIEVRSSVGKGSCFAIQVPLGQTPAVASEPQDGVQPGIIDAIEGSFVVLVDDEADILEAMEALLRQWGCHVVAAGSGAEAVAQLARHERMPDLIISDYRLRGQETGSEAILRIRAAQEANIPAILITGDTAPDRVKEALASGFPLIHKPVSPDKLRLVLATLLAPANQARRGMT